MENHDRRAEAEKVAKAKIGLYIHLLVYVLVNTGLIALNLGVSPERIWFVWPLLGWGLGVLLHALLVFAFPKGARLKEWMVAREMRKSAAQKR
jgi:hypothetical protein